VLRGHRTLFIMLSSWQSSCLLSAVTLNVSVNPYVKLLNMDCQSAAGLLLTVPSCLLLLFKQMIFHCSMKVGRLESA